MSDDLYGFKSRPFEPGVDPSCFFEGKPQEAVLSGLSYALAQGAPVVMVLGDPGVGKSMLTAHIASMIDASRLTAVQLAGGDPIDGDIAGALASAFGLDAAIPEAIGAFLDDEARAGRRCLVVIDEAENLEAKALAQLQALTDRKLAGHPLLQALILARPGFRATVRQRPGLATLHQGVNAALTLAALGPGEVRPYIEHRLARAGWLGNPALDDALFAGIFAATEGIPARINPICNRLLLAGALDQRALIGPDLLAVVVAELGQEGAAPAALPEPAPVPDLPGQVEALLAARDAELADLRQAVLEIADARDLAARIDAIEARLAALEHRMHDHEGAVHEALAMLVDWVEAGGLRRDAA